jgi:carbamoyltransferase
MYIIGISAFYHDSSACLFKNGELIFACEEEKFSRIKHDSSFPNKVLTYIFKKYNISKSEIDCVCYYESPIIKRKRVVKNSLNNLLKKPIYSLKSFFKNIRESSNIDKLLKDISDNVFYSEHHLSHQYYAYYSSEFKGATIVSIDGVGEYDTTAVSSIKSDKMMYSSVAQYPHSLGLFYSAMTSYLGFKPNEGEYKVMGLASYGSKSKYIKLVSELIKFEGGSLHCDMDKFCWDRDNTLMFNHKLIQHLGVLPRDSDEPITAEHEELAHAIQSTYEDILFKILNSIKSNSTNLCLSGGCAYNGKANGGIYSNTNFKKLWIPLAPSDAGSAIGACINYIVNNTNIIPIINHNPFLGPSFDIDEKLLNGLKFKKFKKENELIYFIANKLKDGNVVGWFRGNIEFGARALGNRSILADSTIDGMKDRINKLIKKRESFRPFAPIVKKESQFKFFEMTEDIPYMNQIVKVKHEYINKLKAVTHIDGTARVQTIDSNSPMYKLLTTYEELTGYPILLNTSFNIKDKTMVLKPEDAINTFYTTDLDYLVLGNFILFK